MSSRRILIVRLSALGDVIRALPVLSTLRANLPDAEVSWLVEDRAASLLRGHPSIDRLFVYPRRRWQRDARLPWRLPALAGETAAWLAALRRQRFDVSLDLQGNLKSGVLVALAGARRRIGFAPGEGKEGNHRFQTEWVSVPPGVHRLDRGLALLGPLGLDGRDTRVTLPVTDDERERVRAWLGQEGLRAGEFSVLHPGTSAFAAFKRWPAERFGELATWIRERTSWPVLVSGSADEAELVGRVVRASSGAARPSPAWSRLGELTHLLGIAGLVVGADTGPTHLSAALGTPTVVLFGPKDPALYAPYGDRVDVVWNRVSCSPCTLRQCPNPICMTTMSVHDVREAVERCLAVPPTPTD